MRQIKGVWADLLQSATIGQTIGNWSAEKGDLSRWFTIEGVEENRIVVAGAGLTKPRSVYQADFEKVARLWPEYKQRRVPRQEVRNESRNSTYIISLLHWLEERSA